METALIDLEGLKRISGDDPAFMVEVLSLYADRTERDIEELVESLSKNDLGKIKFVVHRMRSAAVPLGIKDLLVHLKRVELKLSDPANTHPEINLNPIFDIANQAIMQAKSTVETIS